MFKWLTLIAMLVVWAPKIWAQQDFLPGANLPVVPVLANGINLPKLSGCIFKLNDQHCGSDTACVLKYLQQNADCVQALPLYQQLHMLPVNGKVYTNVTVLQMSDNNFVMIDNQGRVIVPLTNLDIENASGFLDLKSRIPAAELGKTLRDFPEAVYLSPTSNQLLFLQDMVDGTCTANCKPIAEAKVLYGFSSEGMFLDANIIRIIPVMLMPTQ